MQKKLLVAALGTLFALPALADEASPLSANVSLVTNYLYRGVTQTADRGAIQGGFDYAHSSGLYAGVWGSNISWLTDSGAYTSGASLELDTYAGFKNSFAGDFTYDLGVLRYNYSGQIAPGSISASTNEIYGALGYKWVTAKYSRSTGNLFGVANSSGSGYFDLSGSYTFEQPAVTLGAHYGKQTVANNSVLDYHDYNLKVSKDFSGYGVGLLINKTNITGDKTRYVLSVSHSM